MKAKAGHNFSVGVAAALAAVTALTGCSVKDITRMPPDTALDGLYSAECEITTVFEPLDSSSEQTEYTVCGLIKRLGGGFWEMDITSPETIAGMHISLDETNMTSALGELSMDCELGRIPDKSPLLCLFNSLDSAAASPQALISCEGGWMMTGTTGNYDYTLILSEEGIPLTLTSEEYGFTAEFISFTDNAGGDNQTEAS